MDFLDRLGLLLTRATTRSKGSSINKEGEKEDNSRLSSSAIIEPTPINRLVIKKRSRRGDIASVFSLFNEQFKGNVSLEEERKAKRKESLERILPFIGASRDDWGLWAYRNRYGIVCTVALYLIILTMVVFISIPLARTEQLEGIFIDFVESQEQLMQYHKNDIIVENKVSDENSESTGEDIFETLDEQELESFEEYELLPDEIEKIEADLAASAMAISSYQSQRDSISQRAIEERADAARERALQRERDKREGQISNKRGNVTVSFNLKGRKAVFLEIPAFLCEGGGQVIVDVAVNRKGVVTDATVKSTIGVDDPSLPETAIWAAKRSRFDSSPNHPFKQKGTITYHFVAQ